MPVTLADAAAYSVALFRRMIADELTHAGLVRTPTTWTCATGTHRYHRKARAAYDCKHDAALLRFLSLPMTKIT